MRRFIPFVFMALSASSSYAAAKSTIPFELHRDYLILTECSVAGHGGLTAIIDTGTTETILDLSLMHRLSLVNWPDSATSLTADTPAQGVRITDFHLGPMRVAALDGVGMDLSAIGKELGVRADLVVGMDVLRRASFTIDYQRRTIEFAPPRAMAHGAALAPNPRLRFALVDSNVLGKKIRLQVDTGFNGLLVYRDRLGGIAVPQDTGARVAGVAQTSGVRTVQSPQVLLGNWEAAHVPVAVMEGAPRDFTDFDGLVGPRFLGAKRVAFDFERGMFYWD